MRMAAVKLLEHAGVRRYGGNLMWLFVEKAFRVVLGLGVGIYMARRIGPAEYGALNYALSFVSLFGVVAGLGLDTIIVRELVNYPELRRKLLATALVMKAVGFGAMLLLLGVTLAWMDNEPGMTLLIWTIAAGYAFQMFQVLDFYFQSRVESRYVVYAQMGALLIVSGLRFYLAYYRWPLVWFAAAEALNMMLTGCGYWFFFRRSGMRIHPGAADRALAWRLLKDCWPLWIGSAAGVVYARSDQLFLKNMLGDAEVGYYAAAVRMAELFYFISMALQSTFFPAILSAKKDSNAFFEERLCRFFALCFYLHLALVLLLLVSGRMLVWFYGEAYAAAYPIFIVYIWRILFCAMGVASSCYFLGLNRQKFSLVFAVSGMVFSCIMNYILIRQFGVVGAAWVAVLTVALIVYVMPLFCRPVRPVVALLLRGLDPRLLLRSEPSHV